MKKEIVNKLYDGQYSEAVNQLTDYRTLAQKYWDRKSLFTALNLEWWLNDMMWEMWVDSIKVAAYNKKAIESYSNAIEYGYNNLWWGLDSIIVEKARNNLAVTLSRLGRYHEAIDIHSSLYESRLARDDKKWASNSSNNIAWCLLALNESEWALQYAQDWLSLLKDIEWFSFSDSQYRYFRIEFHRNLYSAKYKIAQEKGTELGDLLKEIELFKSQVEWFEKEYNAWWNNEQAASFFLLLTNIWRSLEDYKRWAEYGDKYNEYKSKLEDEKANSLHLISLAQEDYKEKMEEQGNYRRTFNAIKGLCFLVLFFYVSRRWLGKTGTLGTLVTLFFFNAWTDPFEEFIPEDIRFLQSEVASVSWLLLTTLINFVAGLRKSWVLEQNNLSDTDRSLEEWKEDS